MLNRLFYRVPALIVCFACANAAQKPPSIPTQPAISFTLDFPASVPSHYSIRVGKDGTAAYESMGKLTPEAEGDPFTYSFTVSAVNVARIFDLATSANYFQDDVDYKKGRQANTGKKTLTYQDSSRNYGATFNYSNHEPIQQLTRLFQSIAATMESARRLQYFHHYQPLALEDELKRMEAMAKDHDPRTRDFEELQAIVPILHEIVDDKSILNVSRARAQRLLALTAKFETAP